jgi:membrane-associated phospholipid phosphatase
MIYGLLFLVTMCTYGAMTAYVTQRLGFPLRDAMFVASDRAMGIDWHALVSWVDRHPTINSMLGFAYGTIGFQLASPIVIFAWLGRADRLRLYLLSVSIALAVTDVIAMLLPAASHIASIDTSAFQIVQFSGATPLQHLAMLRSPDPVVIPGSLGGLLAFPSFHAAVAVLVPFMLRHVKWVFPLSLLINAAMFASAITEGAHYVCDTLAGALVAGVAYLAAKRLLSKQTIRANRPAAAFETSHGAQATT